MASNDDPKGMKEAEDRQYPGRSARYGGKGIAHQLQREAFRHGYRAAMRDKPDLEPLVRELVAALKAAEWTEDFEDGSYCPVCFNPPYIGHAIHCTVISAAVNHAKEAGFE